MGGNLPGSALALTPKSRKDFDERDCDYYKKTYKKGKLGG
jgi:hypothetical protein